MRPSLLVFFVTLFLGITVTFADSNAVTPAQLSGKYTRLTKTGDDAYALELAIRSFKPVTGNGAEVTLISAIHIGSKPYYDALQKIIDAPALLLFEGVGDDHKKSSPEKSEEKKSDDLYSQIAHPLGLVTQLESLNYKRAHFKNADLTIQQLKAILEKEAEQKNRKGDAAREALQHFAQLEKMLSGGDPFTAFVLRGFFGFVGSSPQFRTLLLFHLSTAEDSAQSGMTPGLRRMMRLILHDRNKAAMAMLADELRHPEPPATIGVFYGAAHLAGMEKILVREMGYHLVETRWITAYTLHPKAAGLDDATIANITRRAVKAK